jgi:tRNA dimethylallyltransferase
MNHPAINLVAVLGPTATGKTRLGVAVAHRLGSEIISADSRQVYRRLDLGTGKDLHEYAAVDPPVPHHLIGVAEPETIYSLFDYQQAVFEVLRGMAAREPFASGTPVLLVGGTGLYAEAVLRQYELADVAEDPTLRLELDRQPLDELWRRLCAQAPEVAARTDRTNHRRVVRGLEIAAAEARGEVCWGRPLGLDLRHRIAVVHADLPIIRRRIRERLKCRLEGGLVDEVRGLLRDGFPPQRLQTLGLEYREIGDFLAGRRSYAQMVERLAVRIGQFAKRQLTWFRGMERRGMTVHRVSPGDIDSVLELCDFS